MRVWYCFPLVAVGIAIGVSPRASAQPNCSKNSELVLLGVGGAPYASRPITSNVGNTLRAASVEDAVGELPTAGIYAACLDKKTGHLTSLGIQAQVNHPSWILVDSRKSVVYTTGGITTNIHDGGTIFSFFVEPARGKLKPLGTSPSGGWDPTHLALDEHSGTIFVANHGDGTVGVIKTDSEGGVGALSDKAQQEGSGPSPRQKNAEAHGVAVDPTGQFVVSADFGADKIYVYRYSSATGKLTPAAPPFIATPPGSGPRHVTFTPDGKYVVTNTELDGQVRVYRWDERSGTLQQMQVVNPFPSDYSGQKSAAEIEFSRDGKFLYLSLRGDENKLLTYRWNSGDGKLIEMDRIPAGGESPWTFGLDPSGKWMLVINSLSDEISVFAVNAKTGRLTPTKERLLLRGAITLNFLVR